MIWKILTGRESDSPALDPSRHLVAKFQLANDGATVTLVLRDDHGTLFFHGPGNIDDKLLVYADTPIGREALWSISEGYARLLAALTGRTYTRPVLEGLSIIYVFSMANGR